MLVGSVLRFDQHLFELQALDKGYEQEFELCQKTRHTASTTFLWQIKLAQFIKEKPNDRPIGTRLMIFIAENFFKINRPPTWLRIPKLSEKPEILLPWP